MAKFVTIYTVVKTTTWHGGVAELAYAADLKSASFGIKGSSPFAPTTKRFGEYLRAAFLQNGVDAIT